MDWLYNEILEFCSGDLDELERVLDYFESRLDSDRQIDLENEEDEDDNEGTEEECAE